MYVCSVKSSDKCNYLLVDTIIQKIHDDVSFFQDWDPLWCASDSVLKYADRYQISFSRVSLQYCSVDLLNISIQYDEVQYETRSMK